MVVLIVDDDDEFSSMLASELRRRGCDPVLTAATEVAAVEQLLSVATRWPFVVYVDLAIPGANSRHLITTIKRSVGHAAIVALTESDDRVPPADADAIISKTRSLDEICLIGNRQVAGIFGRAISPYVVVLLKLDELGQRLVQDCGCGCLVGTDEHRFVLTAGHVVRAIERDRRGWVVVGDGSPVRLDSARIIAVDDGLDLGTIELPTSFDAKAQGRKFYPPAAWEAARAQQGDIVGFLGFAGEHRFELGRSVLMSGSVFLEWVTSSSTRHFVIADERRTRVMESRTGRAFGASGGFSGSPVFVNREGATRLAGILKEGSDDGQHSTYFVAHADFVRADGSIIAPP